VGDRPTNSEASGAAVHPIMFWVLTSMGIAVFAPCVLVPIWEDGCRIREHERSAAAQVAGLEARRARNEARLRALLADPLVNERIVRRELNYRPAGERVVHWPAAEPAAARLNLSPAVAVIEDQPDNPAPGWLATLSRWLPAGPWGGLFAHAANRILLLAMAGGLVVSAFVLYGPAPTRGAHPPARGCAQEKPS